MAHILLIIYAVGYIAAFGVFSQTYFRHDFPKGRDPLDPDYDPRDAEGGSVRDAGGGSVRDVENEGGSARDAENEEAVDRRFGIAASAAGAVVWPVLAGVLVVFLLVVGAIFAFAGLKAALQGKDRPWKSS